MELMKLIQNYSLKSIVLVFQGSTSVRTLVDWLCQAGYAGHERALKGSSPTSPYPRTYIQTDLRYG